MRKWMIAASLLVAGSAAWAREFQGNPDRYPSVGLNYQGVSASGDSTVKAFGSSARQDADYTEGNITADLRMPVSDHITLNGALGYINTEAERKENALLAGGMDDLDGFTFNVGVRYYIK